MPSKESRNERYAQGTAVQKYLYASGESGLALMQIATKHRLNQEPAYTKFALLVGDVVLGFYSSNQIVSLLQKELGIDQASANLINPDILGFLKPLTDPNWISPDKEEIQEIVDELSIQEMSSEITEAEAAIESINPLRTMPNDIRSVPHPPESTYTSMQSAILGEGKH